MMSYVVACKSLVHNWCTAGAQRWARCEASPRKLWKNAFSLSGFDFRV